MLRDGNSTLYPLSKDCAESIKDPNWPDLPPITCLGVATHFLHSAASHQKNHVALLVLAIKMQLLMPKILKCDLEGVRQVLMTLESTIAGKICIFKKTILKKWFQNHSFHFILLRGMFH